MATLQITDLHVQIATENGPKEILKGLSLTIETGETHAIMGPNGSGKSTLASTIAGHPRYEVTSGSITLDGEDVLVHRSCWRDVADTEVFRVPIDPVIEQRKADNLRSRLAALRPDAERAVQACRAAYPQEG